MNQWLVILVKANKWLNMVKMCICLLCFIDKYCLILQYSKDSWSIDAVVRII